MAHSQACAAEALSVISHSHVKRTQGSRTDTQGHELKMPVVAFSLVDLIIRPSQRSGINEVKRSGRREAEVLCLQKQCDLAVGRPRS